MANRYKEITKTILVCIALAGAITVSVASPRLAPFLWKEISKRLDPRYRKKEQHKKFSEAFYRLKRSHLLIVKTTANGNFQVELTEDGKRKVKEFKFENLAIQKPKKWDGIWRIIAFDIPNKKTQAREALRNKLRDLSFCQLQKSVWVFPYPCEAEIEFIVELFQLSPYVHIIEAQKIKTDIFLKKRYNLF